MDASGEKAEISDKLLGLGSKIFETIWNSQIPQDAWHWIILVASLIATIGVVLIFILKAAGSALEQLVKAFEFYKSSGLPMWLSPENKNRVKRRKQFCGVLDADLAYLAKSENWNDQYFTDLEAEVETEGGYYASSWNKIRRKKTFGLRKERSLVKAISSSAERAMLLIGEPGSGKSVALRHLAKKLADQGKKSNDKSATVPLYVNLREIESNSPHVTADEIREFVLDNIRRGDADTSAFVRENWNDYCHRGIWLFLFDSFDEIPAVLHSEAGSPAVKQYSQAIRQFLEGMGECKGVLASREFKGPEALPWKKIRILSLSGEKQDELIQNSSLNITQMGLARQHLANSDTTIGATPLFLTLLCRYIRDEQRAPNNDHDILLQHIERLANREPEYLKKKYNLNPEQLIEGAEYLAQIFAENENLSLAPSLDQVTRYLPAERTPGGDVDRLLSALVDCKIGRADVPNIKRGDRRFAFSHRRYQEALFVRYLAKYPKTISSVALLTDSRWREYAVTFLQTRAKSEIQPLLQTACQLLTEETKHQSHTTHTPLPLPKHIHFYSHDESIAARLLELLQEGLSRRLQDVSDDLRACSKNLLCPRWESGDTLDRREVLRLGGLLPNDVLVNYLTEVFENGTQAEREQAFKQAAFARNLPQPARNSVLRILSDQTILASNRVDQLGLEALAARLPVSIGAAFVVARGNRIRKYFRWVSKLWLTSGLSAPFEFAEKLTQSLIETGYTSRSLLSKKSKQIPKTADLLFPLIIIIAVYSTMLLLLDRAPSYPLLLACAGGTAITLAYLYMLCPFMIRAEGMKFNIRETAKWISRSAFSKNSATLATAMAFVISGMFLISWAIGAAAYWVADNLFNTTIFGIASPDIKYQSAVGLGLFFIAFYIIAIPLMAHRALRKRIQIKSWMMRLGQLKESMPNHLAIALSAQGIDELIAWLQGDSSFLVDQSQMRGLSSYMIKINEEREVSSLYCIADNDRRKWKLKLALQILEDRFEASPKSSEEDGLSSG